MKMDREFRARRSSLLRQRGRRRAAIALVCFLTAAGLGLFLWARSSEVFAVQKVVISGIARISQEELQQALVEVRGQNLFRLKTRELAESLKALPYVREAEVWRRFPNALEVHVQEYEPVARVQIAGGACWLVAQDGRVLEKAAPPRGLSLPLVEALSVDAVTAGEELPAPIAQGISVVGVLDADEFENAFGKLTKIVVSVDGATTIVLESQVEVRIGQPVDLDRKLKVAARVLEHSLRVGQQLEYVDVAVPDRVVAKPR
ncbi:MAG: FtsQ-type POTRA domain-containing protein [Thermoleophilia bacterium]|nr:FtsQ-type POTRA domain-containing protein [Thermoleophilia bacterium]